MDDVAAVPKVPKTPAPTALQQAEYARMVYSVTLPEGSTFKDTLDPSFWKHVGTILKPKCRIEVTTEDHAFFAELYVSAADRTWAKVIVLRHVDFNAKSKQVPTGVAEDGTLLDEYNTALHYVDYVQGQTKGRVILREGKVVVKDGFNSKKEAAVWMRAHEEELAKQSGLL